MNESDADLVSRSLSGETGATEALVRRWSARTAAFCHARLGSAAALDDVVQETFSRALERLRTLQSPERFGSWLCGIAHRVCLDYLKSRTRNSHRYAPSNLDGFPAHEPTPLDALVQSDERDKLILEVEALPDAYREVLMIYYYDDVTYDDVAAMLDVSAATVNARLTKARKLLRERLSRIGSRP